MTDSTIVGVAPVTPSASYVEWAPVIGGAFVSAALAFVLFSFGSAAGVASVSPYSYNNPSTTTLTVIATAWFVLVMIGTFLVGGYFAGRMRRPYGELQATERERRDGAHGLLVWALGIVIGILIAATVAGTTARSVSMLAGQAGTAAASAAADSIASYVDTMLRASPSEKNDNDVRPQVSRLLSNATTRGEITSEDRAYLAQVVSVQAGIPEEEARKRVDSTIEQIKASADKARKTAAILGFLIGATSLFAAGAAYWAASMGGLHRDEAIVGA